MHRILCFSGGVDSVVAYTFLVKNYPELHCIFFDYGSNKAEAAFVRKTYGNLDRFIYNEQLQFSVSGTNAYVGNRNVLFAIMAANHFEDKGDVIVYMAGLKDDVVEDKNRKAFELMSQCITGTGRKRVTVKSPFWNFTKKELLEVFVKDVWKDTDVSAEDMIMDGTFSCYSPVDGKECYRCSACFRKACAMYNAGMCWRFDNKTMAQEYFMKAVNGVYVPERCLDIIRFTHKELGCDW